MAPAVWRARVSVCSRARPVVDTALAAQAWRDGRGFVRQDSVRSKCFDLALRLRHGEHVVASTFISMPP